MRERSPPLPKITHPSHPVWAIAGFNKAKCNAESPPGGTAYLITVSSVPGKLSFTLSSALIYPALTETVVVFMQEFTLAPHNRDFLQAHCKLNKEYNWLTLEWLQHK